MRKEIVTLWHQPLFSMCWWYTWKEREKSGGQREGGIHKKNQTDGERKRDRDINDRNRQGKKEKNFEGR